MAGAGGRAYAGAGAPGKCAGKGKGKGKGKVPAPAEPLTTAETLIARSHQQEFVETFFRSTDEQFLARYGN